MALTFPRSFRDFDLVPARLLDEMMRTFERPFGAQGLASAFAPSIDVHELDHEILVEAELPGLDPKDIDIRVENNVLTVRGERRVEDEATRGQAHRQELFYGTFARSIALPATIDQDAVKAELKDGILRLHLPKTERARARQIPIEGAAKAQPLPAKTEAAAPEREPELTGAGPGPTKRR